MAFTFTTLKTAIQDYTENAEATFVTQLPRFILNAEERILKECQLDVFRRNQTGTMTAAWDEASFLLAPTPSSGFTAELHYYYRPTSITTSGDGTSWLGTNAELALLYASLVEANTFMKGEADIMKQYTDRYVEAIQFLKNLGEGRQTRDEYRYDRVRREVQ